MSSPTNYGWRVYSNAALIDNIFDKAIDEETGEILNEVLLEEITRLQEENANLVEDMACFIKEEQMKQEMLKNEIKRLKDMIEFSQQKSEKVKNSLSSILHGNKFETEKVKVSFIKSSSVEISNACSLPSQYWREKITKEPDKKKIMQDLKSNIAVDGASIVRKLNMSIK